MKFLPTGVPQLALNATLGCVGILLYAADVVPPVFVSLVLCLFILAIFVKDGFHGKVYSFSGAILCFLPLSHIIGFVISDTYAFYPNFLISLSDQLNPELRERLALMGLVTMSGLLAGVSAGLKNQSVSALRVNDQVDPRIKPSLSKVVFLATCSVIIMHLDAPEATIFRAAYTESSSISSSFGLGSLFTVGFGLNAMAWYLYFNLTSSYEKRIALYVLIAATGIITVFYQLLRGDREFVGLAICLFYLADRYTLLHRQMGKILVLGVVGFLMLQFFGAYRSTAVDNLGLVAGVMLYFSHGEFFHGTWTAVLLTPLATLGDFYLGQRDHLYGKTYLDYLLSIPPTPVANFFGYLRPITAEQGPAWEVSYGIGGTYISVVPFFNFSMIGVFVQTFLVGLLIGTIDRKSYRNSPLWVLLSFAIGAVLWGIFWYGEMYLLRALVTTFPLLVLVWYALGMRARVTPRNVRLRGR